MQHFWRHKHCQSVIWISYRFLGPSLILIKWILVCRNPSSWASVTSGELEKGISAYNWQARSTNQTQTSSLSINVYFYFRGFWKNKKEKRKIKTILRNIEKRCLKVCIHWLWMFHDFSRWIFTLTRHKVNFKNKDFAHVRDTSSFGHVTRLFPWFE